jgi:hypothetical protein
MPLRGGASPVSLTFASAHKRAAALTQDARTYARGSLASLQPSRAIRRGTYMLRLTIEGHSMAIPVRLS